MEVSGLGVSCGTVATIILQTLPLTFVHSWKNRLKATSDESKKWVEQYPKKRGLAKRWYLFEVLLRRVSGNDCFMSCGVRLNIQYK
eukprot:1425822-Amphidinium_carterae.1